MINQRIMCPNSDIILEKVSTKKYPKEFLLNCPFYRKSNANISANKIIWHVHALSRRRETYQHVYVHKIQVKSYQILQCHSSFESFTSITVHWSITWESFRTTDTSVESIVAETLSVQPNYTNNSPHTAMASGFGLQQSFVIRLLALLCGDG